MPKGFFSQGVAVLLSEAVSIHKIKEVLQQGFEVGDIYDSSEQWEFSGPSVLIPFRPEVNGYITVDIVNRSWPDHMGDPAEDTMLFGAWSMGYFGPFTFPGNLERAAWQSWGYLEGKQATSAHTAFIRVRSTYVLGKTDDEAPIMPEDYEAFPELLLMTAIARALLQLPEALCYFNPNGECLASAAMIDELLERYEQTGLPPLELWSNVRMFQLPQDENWLLMDTVGMLQLDESDHEAIFDKNAYDPNEVDNFLRNVSDYVLKQGPVIQDGDTVDGPGGIQWQGASFENEIAEPPRPVLRWFPMDGRKRPAGLQGELD